MESLGKRLDLEGQRVDQGLAVYGNKGSTDQHAYVQQLRDGVNNFFAVLVRVLESGGERVEVEPGITAGDYLHGFLLGTREALSGNDRDSMTLTVRRVDARTVGALIALFERAVGFYASLVGINAYHQPGVEAGKKAASTVLELQRKVAAALSAGASHRRRAGEGSRLRRPGDGLPAARAPGGERRGPAGRPGHRRPLHRPHALTMQSEGHTAMQEGSPPLAAHSSHLAASIS